MKQVLNNIELKMTLAEHGSCYNCVLDNHSLELCLAANCLVDTVFFNYDCLSDIFKL